MPGLVRTRHALAIRRKSSGSPGKFQNSGGKPEPAPASPADSDAATDPLDDSTSVHRRMDLLLLAKSSSTEATASPELDLRASTASTVPSTVVDDSFSLRSSSVSTTPPKAAISKSAAAPEEEKKKKVPEAEPAVVVKFTGKSAKLTPPPAPAPVPPTAVPKLELSKPSSSTTACSGSSPTSSRRRPLKSAMAHTCADTATATATPKPTQKSVQFSTLEIRTYPVTLGDNPSVSCGPPLTLDWNYTTTHTFGVESYESQRPPTSRRKLSEMALPQSLRIELLCEDARISLRTIEAQCREIERCKKQRRRTADSLRSAWLCRAVRKMAPKRRAEV